MKAVLALSMILGLSCCALAPQPMGDYRGVAIRVTPARPEWLAGYAGAEVCSGRKGDIRRIRWYIVPGNLFVVRGQTVIGYADGQDIYLASSVADRIWLARHEALHTLGYNGHPPAVFATLCKATEPNIADLL